MNITCLCNSRNMGTTVGEYMRLVSVDVNGIDDEEKRRVMIENFVNGRVDVL